MVVDACKRVIGPIALEIQVFCATGTAVPNSHDRYARRMKIEIAHTLTHLELWNEAYHLSTTSRYNSDPSLQVSSHTTLSNHHALNYTRINATVPNHRS